MTKKEENNIQKIKKEIGLKNDKIIVNEKFQELKDILEDFFQKQDSDNALKNIIKSAIYFGSSDVHFDIQETGINIRYRIDGILINILKLGAKNTKLLIERIKFKSEGVKLNIMKLPQDGRFKEEIGDGIFVDVRVSIIPSKFGENITFRILDSSKKIPNIKDLGLEWSSKRQVLKALEKKNGLILVTGPTGSGKTTTLYSMLQRINKPERKIITLENPIEYDLPGIIQSEINDKNGYGFQLGLKSILRQDPDIVMIGEIRTLDTAKIASRASLTGHLVLSTLHTNNAAETIDTLLNMGVEPYVMAGSIDIIISQRLIRRVCPHCSEMKEAGSREIDIIEWMLKDIGLDIVNELNPNSSIKLPIAKGCKECSMSGYKGRIGIYEVINFDKDIRKAIRENKTTEEIVKLARKNDMILMKEDGIIKAMRGITTLEELFRVID